MLIYGCDGDNDCFEAEPPTPKPPPSSMPAPSNSKNYAITLTPAPPPIAMILYNHVMIPSHSHFDLNNPSSKCVLVEGGRTNRF